jgi:hypothetical protein
MAAGLRESFAEVSVAERARGARGESLGRVRGGSDGAPCGLKREVPSCHGRSEFVKYPVTRRHSSVVERGFRKA